MEALELQAITVTKMLASDPQGVSTQAGEFYRLTGRNGFKQPCWSTSDGIPSEEREPVKLPS
jgi:hypothetical protein